MRGAAASVLTREVGRARSASGFATLTPFAVHLQNAADAERIGFGIDWHRNSLTTSTVNKIFVLTLYLFPKTFKYRFVTRKYKKLDKLDARTSVIR